MVMIISNDRIFNLLVFASPFLVLGFYIIVMNWVIEVRRRITRKFVSLLPFVGGILCAIGMALLPYKQMQHLWWLPLILDPGFLPPAWQLFRMLFKGELSGQ